MPNHIEELSFKQSQTLYDTIKPNETVLWTGTPLKKNWDKKTILPLGFSFLWLSALVYIFMVTKQGQEMVWKERLIALPFLLIGLQSFVQVLRKRKQNKSNLYALTNKHAYMIYPDRAVRNDSFPMHALKEIWHTQNKDATYSIIFDVKKKVTRKIPSTAEKRNTRRQLNRIPHHHKKVLGFLSLTNSDEVLKRLQEINSQLVIHLS